MKKMNIVISLILSSFLTSSAFANGGDVGSAAASTTDKLSPGSTLIAEKDIFIPYYSNNVVRDGEIQDLNTTDGRFNSCIFIVVNSNRGHYSPINYDSVIRKGTKLIVTRSTIHFYSQDLGFHSSISASLPSNHRIELSCSKENKERLTIKELQDIFGGLFSIHTANPFEL